MPRVSKRKRNSSAQRVEKIRYYRTYIYVRLSEKDGGHGRKDSIVMQKQICVDFAEKHPEMLISRICIDNGITGTTFDRPEFGSLMEDVRSGKVDCIVVKDFSRFGRDALDAVDLIDVIFPTLGVRFVSVMDNYDSENPACVGDRAKWTPDMVKKVLENPIRAGIMVNHKTESRIVGSDSHTAVPKEQWICVLGMHDAIVTKGELEKVLSMVTKKKNPNHSERNMSFQERLNVDIVKEGSM